MLSLLTGHIYGTQFIQAAYPPSKYKRASITILVYMVHSNNNSLRCSSLRRCSLPLPNSHALCLSHSPATNNSDSSTTHSHPHPLPPTTSGCIAQVSLPPSATSPLPRSDRMGTHRPPCYRRSVTFRLSRCMHPSAGDLPAFEHCNSGRCNALCPLHKHPQVLEMQRRVNG
jgi:hypothetical protein